MNKSFINIFYDIYLIRNNKIKRLYNLDMHDMKIYVHYDEGFNNLYLKKFEFFI